jgi:altronate dehydratase large subunit
MQGYRRQDGRKGIRNYVLVAYLVECAHHVARAIATPFEEDGVQVIGFPGCYPSDYALSMMKRLCTHPNVGAVLLVSLGCEEFKRSELQREIAASGRPVSALVIQETGGTRETTAAGRAWVRATLAALQDAPRVPLAIADLVIGTECGGSDGFSGITANPAIGIAIDHVIDQGGTGMFEETCELIGCEHHMAGRAATPELGRAIVAAVEKADSYYRDLEHGSFGGGNIAGGLSTIEEKSIGAYAKSGTRPIVGLLKPGIQPTRPGLYLMDMVNDGGVRFGIPNINDSATVIELVACGCHMVLFSTGRGSVVGSAIAPVIKVCSNPETYRRMAGDMDVDAGRIIEDRGTLAEVGREIFDLVQETAGGRPTKSEALGHQEFILTYKTFEPLGPSCLPV